MMIQMAEDRRTSLAPAGEAAPGTDLRPYLPGVEPERQVNDWGRSERVEGLMDRTLIEFFYKLWGAGGYDDLDADELIALLRSLEPEALAELAAHEGAHAARPQVMKAIASLQGWEART